MMTEVELANWEGEGGYEYRPRLRDIVQRTERRPLLADEEEAPEIDMEYDCD